LTFRCTAGRVVEALHGLSVGHADIHDGRVRLLSNEPEAVLRALFDRGVEISDLEVVGASLEEAFVSLTGRRNGEEVLDAARAGEKAA
jgi:ABC-2 type transport system ATP-binding protein